MSLRPFLRGFWDDAWEGMGVPSRIYDQHFGNPIAQEFLFPAHAFSRMPYGPPMGMPPRQPPQQTGLSEVCVFIFIVYFL